MKKNEKNNKKKLAASVRSKASAFHVLIAVVAVIECLVLISFIAFSWIETSSTLIIETGKKNLTDANDSRIPIANAMNYKFTIDSDIASDTSIAELSSFFSHSGMSSTDNLYRYSRTSSVDGKTFYFKKTSAGSTYRIGDSTDINSNYTYYDFVLSNKKDVVKTHKYKFYFADPAVFSVSNDTGSTLTDTQLTTIRNAMRISFQTGAGTPKIYSAVAQTYTAVNAAGGTGTEITTTQIVSNSNTQKLFTIGKNAEQKISVRIWLEEKATGMSGITAAQLAGAKININLKITYAQNDYDYLYFDDYTFSSGKNNKSNIGGHLTEDFDESNTHRMYFVYQTSSDGADRHVYPMTIDDSGSNVDARSWITCDDEGTPTATVPDVTDYLYITRLTKSSGTDSGVDNALKYSYFAYGVCNAADYNSATYGFTTLPTVAPLYVWRLNNVAASEEAELRYNAFSVTAISSSNAASSESRAATSGYGAGGWASSTSLTMLWFRDLATGNTSNAYNGGTNFKYMTESVNADSDSEESGNRSDVLYVNMASSLTANEANARATAAMYYDKTADSGSGLFCSWVPTSWLGDSIYFRYCPGGYYNNAAASSYCAVCWAADDRPNTEDEYIYTAVGYASNDTVTSFNTSDNIADGVGSWNRIESEPVFFSTELIDGWADPVYRYQVGVKINGGGTVVYYNLIPDASNMLFYAYIPVAGAYDDNPAPEYGNGDILFRSYDGSGDVNAVWYGKARKGSHTYYPVKADTVNATAAAPKGFWNISVIVDGTYEHFFWDTRVASDPNDDGVLGVFGYNTSGHEGAGADGYTDITPNKIDEYRWYIPLDDLATIPEYVYYRWVPYDPDGSLSDTPPTLSDPADETIFYYTQKLSDGIYCVVTEAPDGTPANAFTP